MRAGKLSVREPGGQAAVQLVLARHQQRREQGIPTLSVLVGAPAEAEAAWRDWSQSAGQSVSIRQVEEELESERRESVLFVCEGADKTGLTQLVEHLCRALDALGGDTATNALALAVEPSAASAFLRDEPHSRARTLFAEGMVFLPTVPVYSAAGYTDTPPALPLMKVPLRAETRASFTTAATALRLAEASPAETGEIDRARSAAERFLFELLHDLPETAGLFELNVRLDFCFGPMRAEVDLLAAGLRLAVEIDGFYHFRDPDGYRRDRRKDALLQRQGFLVLRFLAEDVVVRLEEILEEIRTTVAFRRATMPRAEIS